MEHSKYTREQEIKLKVEISYKSAWYEPRTYSHTHLVQGSILVNILMVIIPLRISSRQNNNSLFTTFTLQEHPVL